MQVFARDVSHQLKHELRWFSTLAVAQLRGQWRNKTYRGETNGWLFSKLLTRHLNEIEYNKLVSLIFSLQTLHAFFLDDFKIT